MVKSLFKNILSPLAGIGLIVSASVAVANEADPRSIGIFKDWQAYTWLENGEKVCYMLSRPTKSLPKNANRGDIYLMITHRPKSKSKEEISHVTGYPYKDQSTVKFTVGNQNFILATDEDVAWVPDGESDAKLINAFRNGSKLTVTGTSSRGTVTTDSYSLQGFTAAHKQIRKSCS
ncbi:invasion associated locus B family protein [Sneathiella chinensis]|uniref:Uncharacterized protein n=1 Tax=Sneathiella chinensis TaxID=349750 RepID=A0ABQ5U8E4_9PROT|nr:invasion associated locus B family protein [Sneathiella chinensis]GLQ07948.1 hypothetical protein GCM10007924_31700 [Sneathiella chinensis]